MKKEYITPKTATVAVKTCYPLQASDEIYTVNERSSGGESFVGDNEE